MNALLRSRRIWVALSLIALLSAGLTWQRQPLLAWYFARQLAAAPAEGRQAWLTRAVGLDETVVPDLVGWLSGADSSRADNVQAGLMALASRWGADDARSQRLAERLRVVFERCSVDGQRGALHVLAAVLRQKGPARLSVALSRAAGEVLCEAEKSAELREPALLLAAALVERVAPGQWLATCRALANQGLGATDAGTRLAAVQLMLCEPLRQERDLLAKVVPLLRDRSATIRRASLVALAPARELVSEDALLPLLHDEDVEVQHVCEVALRSRGLDESHILLARLISDEDPAARLRVLQHLGREADLSLGVWLRRLSQDSAAAVRAAAVRAVGIHPQLDLSERLREMAQGDPSETVRQNAQHYLRQQQAVP
jgi:hypothetical protein